MIRANLPSLFRIVGPVYEVIYHVDGTIFACERHADGRLVDCKIDDKPVTAQEYVDPKDDWKDNGHG